MSIQRRQFFYFILILLFSSVILESTHAQNGFQSLHSKKKDQHYLFTQSVLNNLVEAMDISITQLPLKIISDKNEVAFINTEGIFVSEKFVELCWSLGANADDAMAYILAHELGHYKMDHFFALEFGSAYASTDWGSKMSDVFFDQKEMGIFETEADEYGLYFSYSAGYNTFDIGHDLIARIYHDFDLPDSMAGYPPKAFRQLQAIRAQESVEQLIPVFEIGNYMNILAGQAKEDAKKRLLTSSQKCYFHLIDNKITTIEMYNNLGLNFLSEALIFKQVEFALPMELDFYTRLYVKSPTIIENEDWEIEEEDDGWGSVDEEWGDEEEEESPSPPPPPSPDPDLSEFIDDEGWETEYEPEDPFLESIEKARIYFERCLTIDRSYAAAYNNLAATNLLLEEYEEAFAKARKALRLAKQENDVVTERNAIDLLVLIHFFMDEPEDCLDYMYLSKDNESPIFTINYEYISKTMSIADSSLAEKVEGVSKVTAVSYDMVEYDELEKIGDKLLYDITYELLFETDSVDQRISLANATAQIIKHEVEQHDFYVFSNIDRGSFTDRFAFYDVTESSDVPTFKGVMMNDSLEKVTAGYGQPIKIISGNRYDYWIYYNHNIIFKIKQDNTVGGWVFYDVE
ncbi:MAG: hypothetical protein R2730_14480 [Chitinophagales bacterium]